MNNLTPQELEWLLIAVDSRQARSTGDARMKSALLEKLAEALEGAQPNVVPIKEKQDDGSN